jgi:hypothetical protein
MSTPFFTFFQKNFSGWDHLAQKRAPMTVGRAPN